MKTKTQLNLIVTGLILFVFTATNSFSQSWYENWERHPQNPIMDGPVNWTDSFGGPVIIYEDDTYKMWFTSGEWEIGYAESDDGYSWEIHQAPVIIAGTENDWDYHKSAGVVLRIDDTLRMWYSGIDSDWTPYRLGFAWSLDGISWQVNEEPVLEGASFPSMHYDGTIFHMYYTSGWKEDIDYATSADGITWIKATENNPVIERGAPGTWNDYWVTPEGLIMHNDTLHMFFDGRDGTTNNYYIRTGYAWSVDFINWTVNDDYVFDVVAGGWESEGVSAGTILFEDDKYKMWYGGETFTDGAIGYAEIEMDITCLPDGWERMADMPEATSWYGSCYDSISETAYIFGGGHVSSGTQVLSATTQIYDFKTDTFTLGADMPNKASAFSAEMVNGKIYIIGEWMKSKILTNVKEYDPVNDTWVEKGQLPEIFYAHGSCVYEGLIYSFGGRDVNFNLINTVRAYNPLTDTWNKLEDMPYKKEKSAVCIYEDEIYLFGDNPSLKYTPSTDSWTELDVGIYEIDAYAVPIIDGDRILLFGGYKYGDGYPNPSDEIWAYYPASDTLVEFDIGMPFNRFTGGHKYNNSVYLFGGHYSNTLGSVTDTVWRLDLLKVSINENEYVSRKDFILHQNYPNPFSGSTTIEYELKQSSTVQITIYNHLGKQLKVIEQKQSAGKQQVVWNAERLPGGVYFCVLKTESGMQTMKMIKLK